MKFWKIFLILGILVFLVMGIEIGSVYAQYSSGFSGSDYRGTATYSNYYTRLPDFQNYYRADRRLDTYFPILTDPASCFARQDIILQVSPLGGCQPAVVRSDLLAEQNVPVFCQIEAIKINPLLDIKQIRNIRFSGTYPEEVAGVGFHPTRAALRTRDRLLGSPIVNNIGYIVVVLKQIEREEDIPDLVNFTLQAQLEYYAQNALGIGRTEFLLSEMTNAEWETDKGKQSFWEGRFFVRLLNANPNAATIGIYQGDIQVSTVTVQRGRTSREIYVPGSYCQYGLQVAYDGFQSADKIARLRVGDDVIDVFKRSRFLNNKCSVANIQIGNLSGGSIDIQCQGERLSLSTGPKNASNILYERLYLSEKYDAEEVKQINIYFDSEKEKTAGLYIKGDKLYSSENEIVGDISNSIIVLRSEEFEKIMKEEIIPLVKQQNPDLEFDNDKLIKDFFNLFNNAEIKDSFIFPEQRVIAIGDGLIEIVHSEAAEEYFKKTIDSYEQVANDYPIEKKINLDGVETYGEQALKAAIALAGEYNKEETRARLINKFLDRYTNSLQYSYYTGELNRLITRDITKAAKVIHLDNEFVTIRLLDVFEPEDKANAVFIWGNQKFNVELEESKNFSGIGEIALLDIINTERVRVGVSCADKEDKTDGTFNLEVFESGRLTCGKTLKLDSVNLQELAKIRIIPVVRGPLVETNLTVGIGIEKRAIKLNPDKAKEKIEFLQENVDKWEKISNNLGKVVKGLKGACFATAGVLTVKNFFTGLSGEAIARQKLMQGYWNQECNRLVNDADYATSKGVSYSTINACYLGEADNINSDVNEMKGIINSVNNEIKQIQAPFKEPVEGLGGLFGEAYVNTNASANILRGRVFNDYKDFEIKKEDGTLVANVSDLTSDVGAYDKGHFRYDQLREITTNLELWHSTDKPHLKKFAMNNLVGLAGIIKDNQRFYEEHEQALLDSAQGFATSTIATAKGQGKFPASVVSVDALSNDLRNKIDFDEDAGVKYAVRISAVPYTEVNDAGEVVLFFGGVYVLGARKDSGRYTPVQLFKKEGDEYIDKSDELGDFTRIYGIGEVIPRELISYNNPYKNPVVRYYDTEPKGPAIVPLGRFGIQNGWYAATRQTLPSFGGIGSFESSGRIASFWLCNVGVNGREQFFEGINDDICQLVNTNTGQPLNVFPELGESQARKLIQDAIRALNDAARQYGKSYVNILGEGMRVGEPAANIPGTKCQDFMDPKDCHLLFNVCDPVICPSSRCDLGGAYPVSNVIQTGIVGSIALCLPNVREGIVIPVCLTGIQAGIDGYVSILKQHQACLQENLDNGRLVGICDELTSIYTCEFFWRQAAPATRILVPKLFEVFTGQTTPRGGGEYLNVKSAWDNAQSSVDYFTNFYAVNSLDAFNVRSVEEAGSTFCKAFISAKAPTAFETLIEPDSPVQFHAWFDSIRFTDVTVPPTAQYKVFYHIFAGKDRGAAYNVYLKDPPETSYYYTTPIIQVASGFIPRGESFSETIDFTSPEGYQQLCVRINAEEKCGFKQVSTSFAVNYLRDSYLSTELDKRDVSSEKECISGSPNIGALLQPNIQAGLEEVVFPEIYNRGIVRICATHNPGSATDPVRFADVGNCGDVKIRCWLDKTSVDNAITDNNKYLQNKTLSEIENIQRQTLEIEGEILPEPIINEIIGNLSGERDKFKGELARRGEVYIWKADDLAEVIDATLVKVLLNNQKAQLVFLKGQVYEIVARFFIERAAPNIKDAGKPLDEEPPEPGPSEGGEGGDGDANHHEFDPDQHHLQGTGHIEEDEHDKGQHAAGHHEDNHEGSSEGEEPETLETELPNYFLKVGTYPPGSYKSVYYIWKKVNGDEEYTQIHIDHNLKRVMVGDTKTGNYINEIISILPGCVNVQSISKEIKRDLNILHEARGILPTIPGTQGTIILSTTGQAAPCGPQP